MGYIGVEIESFRLKVVKSAGVLSRAVARATIGDIMTELG